MGHTVVGVFRHSGDADMAADYLREKYTLDADELDEIGETEWDRLNQVELGGASPGVLVSDMSIELQEDEELIGKRWRGLIGDGDTLVVARAHDPEMAQEIAEELRRTGADRVDLI